jgi:branched-chain amino acid transport system permease protein
MPAARRGSSWWLRADVIFLLVALLIPVVEAVLPTSMLPDWLRIGTLMRPIFILAILGLGLNVVTGFTGLLNLGVAAFMAIGAYAYAILSSEIYPFRLGFWPALAVTPVIGAIAGLLLGAPALRLRGDYLAIVTLGFGEIVQDVLKNLDTITKGTQGINPLPDPVIGAYSFPADQYQPWYYLFLAILVLVVVISRNLEHSRLGRSWVSIREDELAATCMGVRPVKTKLLAFATGAAMSSLAGALWACMLDSTGEPANYDFAVSILAVCMMIVGGMGNINGVLLGALVMVGLDSIILNQLNGVIQRSMPEGVGSNVLLTPTNWKFMIFGLALVFMMRFKPEGLLPSRSMKVEMHHDDAPAAKGAAAA